MRELNSYHQLCNSALEMSPVPGASSDTSSSPRSSTTEDDLHEVSCHTEQGACNSSKPIYNFSIPDFIKHERQPAPSVADGLPVSEESASTASPQRPREPKRRREQRDDVGAANNLHPPAQVESRSACRKKRRRTEQVASRQNPELIDLTGVADHDDGSSVRLLDEIDQSPYLDPSLIIDTSRDEMDNPIPDYVPSRANESDLEQFRRRLRESRDRIRREVASRELRVRHRLSHPNDPCSEEQRIVSDGIAYTSQQDLDLHSNFHQSPENQQSFGYRNPEAPIINLEEDNHGIQQSRNRQVTRMILDDSLYSPPYVSHLNPRQAPSLGTIEESADRLEQRRRERERNIQRIRQQTQERINEVRNRLSRLGQQINNNNNNNSNSSSGSFHIHISDSPQGSRHFEDEVEFLRELRPQNTSTQSARQNDGSVNGYTNNSWNHLARRRRFSNLLSSASIPDFLFPYVHFISPSATQRLHHFPPTFLDDGEDYESPDGNGMSRSTTDPTVASLTNVRWWNPVDVQCQNDCPHPIFFMALWSLAERLGPAKPRGLSKTEIDRLHAFRYSASRADETNTTCVVCMSEYCLKEKIRKLPCTHDFHSKCIDKWLKSNKTCPVCRDEVKCA